MASFNDIEGFCYARVNVHGVESTTGSRRLLVDRGFVRVQATNNPNREMLYRFAVAERLSSGTQGSDVMFIPFESLVSVEKGVVKSPNGSMRKGKITIILALPVACGSFLASKIVMKMNLDDCSVLYANIYHV